MKRRLTSLRTNLQARCRAALSASRIAHALFFLGLAAIVVGCGKVYEPLGFLAAGFIGIWVSVLIAAESAKG